MDLVLELPRSARTTPEELLALRVRSGDANALPEPGAAARRRWSRCANWSRVERTIADKSIYHKNLMPVTYVIGDVAGVVESPVYAILKMNQALAAARHARVRRRRRAAARSSTPSMPFTDQRTGA